MIERIRLYWTLLLGSLWFIPVLMAVTAAAVAIVLLTAPVDLPEGTAGFWLLYSGNSENARELMSSLLTGMITMTSLVVSITMVVLTLAAGQIGPRLIRSFMSDRQTQLVLGLFLANIIYLLVVFRTIGGDDADHVPRLAVSAGTALSAFSLFVLLYFVHRLARSIIYDNVVQSVAVELRRTSERLLPRSTDEDEVMVEPAGSPRWIDLACDGYIQSVETGSLVAAAAGADVVIRLEVRPGHYVLSRGEHVAVFPAHACTQELVDEIRAAFVIGSERSTPQDLEYGIRQLVEIAVRALSPGINDVFTALAVIDSLSASLGHIFDRGLEPRTLRDDEGSVRVIRDTSSYEGLVGAAFDLIRQNGRGDPAILIRLADAMDRLAPCIRSESQRAPLLEQLEAVLAAGEESVKADRDISILRDRCRSARIRLTSSSVCR